MASAPPPAPPPSSSYGGPDPLAPPADLPLWRARVLFTAPRSYAGALGGRLLDAGADVVWIPGVRTQRLEADSAHAAALDAALEGLVAAGRGGAPPPYAAVLFTSRAGVDAVLERLGVLAGADDPLSPRAARVAAGGAALAASGVPCWALGADAGALAAAGVPSVHTPAAASTAGLVDALREQGPWPPGTTFLAPVPAVGGGLAEPPVVPAFLAGLAALPGAPAVVAPPAYATLPGLEAGRAAAVRADLDAGRLDAVVFSSTAEAQGLAAALGRAPADAAADGAAALRAAVAARRVVLAAHGPTTAAGVADALGGCEVGIVSADYSSFAGVVTALEEAWRERRKTK
jgi:uroporphyrinogen-III synthase